MDHGETFVCPSKGPDVIKGPVGFQRRPSDGALMQKMYGLLLTLLALTLTIAAQTRPRARDLGVAPGVLPPGTLNAITDVGGVRVGHTTVSSGDHVRTGVTAVLPHG